VLRQKRYKEEIMPKTKKNNSIILKSFIAVAVMMIISVTPGQGSKNITKITERLISCYNCYKQCR